MPKATLTFQLPEDEVEYQCAVHSMEMFNSLCEIDSQLKKLREHPGNDQLASMPWIKQIRYEVDMHMARMGI